jgi:DNA polymerase III alpha subunit
MLKPSILIRVRSHYSFVCAVGSPARFVERAAALGCGAVALTDVDSLAGQVEFREAGEAFGVTTIAGVATEARGGARAVLLAKDRTGYATLCRFVSRRRARALDVRDVSQFDGLMALTDDPATLAAWLDRGLDRAAARLLLTRPCTRRSGEAALFDAARRLEVPLVAEFEANLPDEADAPLLELSTAVQARRQRRRALPRRTATPLVGSPEKSFEDAPFAIDAARKVIEECRFDLRDLRKGAGRAAGADAESVRELGERLQGYRPPTPAHATRLDRELATIAELRLSGYFLVVAAMADEARRRGISVLGRGSAVSSLVVHALGLSPIDPVREGLYFERFARASRRDPPDIDLDVSYDRREELLDWAHERFGRAHVAAVGAYQTFQRRSAYRDGLAALGLSASEVDRFARAMPDDELGLPAPVALLPARLRGRAPLIERLVGCPRHLATHPSALVVSPAPLLDCTPLVRAPKGVLVTELDGRSLEQVGLLKVDLLGNRALAELEEVSRTTGTAPLSAPDDPRVFAAIGRGDTVGCHQLESPLVRAVLERMPIQNLADVTAAIALVRPGAGSGIAKETFLRAARGEVAPGDGAPPLLFEEDAIRLIAETTGCSAAEADEIRASVVRGDDASGAFVARAVAHGVAREHARQTFRDVERFAAYSFSKAHAASVAWLAYRSVHARVHHPKAFASALLNHHGGLYPSRAVAADLVRSGVVLRAPHVNASAIVSTVEADSVRIGLAAIGPLSPLTRQRIVDLRARGGPFQTLADVRSRIRPARPELVALVLSGACDGLPPLSPADYPFAHQVALGMAPECPRDRRAARLTLYRALVRVNNELRFLGMHPSHHPMSLLRAEATRAGCIAAATAKDHRGSKVAFAGVVSALRRVRTGDGRIMQFVTFEDETALLSAVLPADTFHRLEDPITHPGPYLIEGIIDQDAGHIALRVGAVRPFHRRENPYGA